MPVATVEKYGKIICDSNEKCFVLTFVLSLSLSLSACLQPLILDYWPLLALFCINI